MIQQQGPTGQAIQQIRRLTAAAAAAEQIGAIRPQQGAIEAHHQLVPRRRTEMHQGGDVVLLQPRFTADQYRPGLASGRRGLDGAI